MITPLWGDGSVPVKMINPTDKTMTLRRNAKIANVSPCIAVEDLPEADTFRSNVQYGQQSDSSSRTKEDMAAVLKDLELQDIDLESCEVSLAWKDKLLRIIEGHETIFSRHEIDCGDAKDFVHRIHLVDNKPFRLPYRGVPPRPLREAENCSQ